MIVLLVAGIDEAGRGPLAGPVVAGAVILDPERPIRGLRDSKQLTAPERDRLAVKISARALAWAVAEADVAEIDDLNILQATLVAMRRAVAALSVAPGEALVDGNHCPSLGVSRARDCRWRSRRRRHFRRIDSREDRAGLDAGRAGPRVSRVRIRAAQGLRDPGASRRACSPRTLSRAPAEFCAGATDALRLLNLARPPVCRIGSLRRAVGRRRRLAIARSP